MAKYGNGECPVCRIGWALRKDGRLRQHGVDCPGEGQVPLVVAPNPYALYLKMCETRHLGRMAKKQP